MSNGNQQAPGTGSRSPRSGGGPVPATYSSSGQPTAPAPASPSRYQRIALVALLDRLLAGGVVISGEVRLAIADVDLVSVSLRALIASVSTPGARGPAEEEDSR